LSSSYKIQGPEGEMTKERCHPELVEGYAGKAFTHRTSTSSAWHPMQICHG